MAGSPTAPRAKSDRATESPKQNLARALGRLPGTGRRVRGDNEVPRARFAKIAKRCGTQRDGEDFPYSADFETSKSEGDCSGRIARRGEIKIQEKQSFFAGMRLRIRMRRRGPYCRHGSAAASHSAYNSTSGMLVALRFTSRPTHIMLNSPNAKSCSTHAMLNRGNS